VFLHCLFTSQVNKISSKLVLEESDVLITQGSLHFTKIKRLDFSLREHEGKMKA